MWGSYHHPALSPSVLSPGLLAPLQGLDSPLETLAARTGSRGGGVDLFKPAGALLPALPPDPGPSGSQPLPHLLRTLDARRSWGVGVGLASSGRVCPCSTHFATLEVGNSGASTRQPPLWSLQCCGEGLLPQGCSQTSHE